MEFDLNSEAYSTEGVNTYPDSSANRRISPDSEAKVDENTGRSVASWTATGLLGVDTIHPGDVVLVMGAGSGEDLVRLAEQVGDKGKVVAVEASSQAVETCRRLLLQAGILNVELYEEELLNLPIADGTVDCIMTDCATNLCRQKQLVFEQAHRTLKPGGRIMVCDVVTDAAGTDVVPDLGDGCLSRAVQEEQLNKMLQRAGFVDLETLSRKRHSAATIMQTAGDGCLCRGESKPLSAKVAKTFAEGFVSVRLQGRKRP